MGVGVWKHLRRWALGGSAALLLAGGMAWADDADTQKVIQELKTRMEQMEKQNQQLQQKVQQMQQSGGTEASEQAEEGNPAPGGNLSEDSVRKLIADYMQEDAAKKLAAEEAKKKADSEAFSEITNDTPMTGIFDNGFLLTSKNKAFTARVGLEVQADAVWQQAPFNVQFGKGGVGYLSDGVNLRRDRVDVRGSAWDNFLYLCQWDFTFAQQITPATLNTVNSNVFATPQPMEVWGQITDLPLVRNIRIGNQKPLWSFEDWNSSRFQDFMERSLGWDAFVENQNNGFIPAITMLNYTENERACLQLGIAKNLKGLYFWQDPPTNGNDLAEARVTFLPWYCQNGRYMMHLGLGSMYGDAFNDIVLFRARSELRDSNNLLHEIVTAARVNAHSEARLCPEFYMALGPVYFQAEYYGAWAFDASTMTSAPTYTAKPRNVGTYYAYSYYIQSFIYLTGENYLYNRQLARLEQPNPQTNFFWHRGCGKSVFGTGCWLTGIRYNWINLGDEGVNGSAVAANGGQTSSAGVWDWTYSLKWIMTPNTQVMWNYDIESRNAATTPQSNGYIKGFGMRFQLQF